MIGKPWSPDVAQHNSTPVFGNPLSPISPVYEVVAYAGPMPIKHAENMYNQLKGKSPARIKKHRLSMDDPYKGVERVARTVADDIDVPWNEYWPFLDCYCNIKSPTGLAKLESHFKQKTKEVMKDKVDQTFDIVNGEISLSDDHSNLLDPIQAICSHINKMTLDENGSIGSLKGYNSLLHDTREQSISASPEIKSKYQPVEIVDNVCNIVATGIGNLLNDLLNSYVNEDRFYHDKFQKKWMSELKDKMTQLQNLINQSNVADLKRSQITRLHSKLANICVGNIPEEDLSVVLNILQYKATVVPHDILSSPEDEDVRWCHKSRIHSPQVLSLDEHCACFTKFLTDRINHTLVLSKSTDENSNTSITDMNKFKCLQPCNCEWKIFGKLEKSRQSSLSKRFLRKSLYPNGDDSKTCSDDSFSMFSKNMKPRLLFNGEDETDSDMFFTPPSSPQATTPEEGIEIYIHG